MSLTKGYFTLISKFVLVQKRTPDGFIFENFPQIKSNLKTYFIIQFENSTRFKWYLKNQHDYLCYILWHFFFLPSNFILLFHFGANRKPPQALAVVIIEIISSCGLIHSLSIINIHHTIHLAVFVVSSLSIVTKFTFYFFSSSLSHLHFDHF